MSKKCIKCYTYKERKEFIDSQGWTCNNCFAYQKEVLKLGVGDEITYCFDSIKEDMIITQKPFKIGSRWYLMARQKEIESEGSKILVAYTRKK